MLFVKLDDTRYLSIIFVSNIVQFVGELNVNRSPLIGLMINNHKRRTNGTRYGNQLHSDHLSPTDLSLLPESLSKLMEIDYFIHSINPDSENGISFQNRVDKHTEGQEISYLDCSCDCFIQCTYSYLYELSQELCEVTQNVFSYFIGEFTEVNHTVLEYSGKKVIGPNSYSGELPVILQSEMPATHSELVLPDRSYSGYTKGAQPNGLGHMFYYSENQFVGFSRNGLMDYGCYFHLLKYYIISAWEARSRVGYTMEQYADGVVYFGQIKNGIKDGLGVILMANGSVIMGNWRQNKVQGLILSFSHVATVFAGQVSDESFNGYGEMFYRNRSYYYGNWDRGQYHSLGRLVDNDRPMVSNRVHYWIHGVVSNIHFNENRGEESQFTDPFMNNNNDNTSRDPANQQQTLD